MAATLSICRRPGCLFSGTINHQPTSEESRPGPHLQLPAAVCASRNPAKREAVEQVDLSEKGGQDGVKTDFGI